MYIAAGIIKSKAEIRYLWVVSVELFIDINTNPRTVITGSATIKPDHLASICFASTLAPTTIDPETINCRTNCTLFTSLL